MDFYQLNALFPLRPIKDEDTYNASMRVIDGLVTRLDSLNEDERDYLDVLSDLVEKYEEVHYPVEPITGVELLRGLMENNGLSMKKLSKEIGVTNGMMSKIMSGHNIISIKMARKLGERFRIDFRNFI